MLKCTNSRSRHFSRTLHLATMMLRGCQLKLALIFSIILLKDVFVTSLCATVLILRSLPFNT
uniref:Uncharacterized protein n=1 Tax=Populus trichocarpa TaxID=3694 RepID=A9PC00_POPTR|nr:unknown [Populus trichocarpa]